MFTFQNCELLAEGKVLQHQAAATAKSANDGSAPEPKQVKHGSQSYSRWDSGLRSDVVEFKGGRNSDEGQDCHLNLAVCCRRHSCCNAVELYSVLTSGRTEARTVNRDDGSNRTALRSSNKTHAAWQLPGALKKGAETS